MKRNSSLNHKDSLSQYNTFKIFEKFYNSPPKELTEIEAPPPEKAHPSFLKIFLALIIIIIFGLSLQPVLGYFLKTPYPLIVVSDNNFSPLLKQGDIILSKGIINLQQVQSGDLVVFYYSTPEEQKIFSVRQVKAIQAGQLVLTDLQDHRLVQPIENKYVVGQVVGGRQPWRLPFIGQLVIWWTKLNRYF